MRADGANSHLPSFHLLGYPLHGLQVDLPSQQDAALSHGGSLFCMPPPPKSSVAAINKGPVQYLKLQRLLEWGVTRASGKHICSRFKKGFEVKLKNLHKSLMSCTCSKAVA